MAHYVRLFAGLIVLGTCSASLQAAEIKTSGKIVAATVYADRATVTREATINVAAGASTLELTDLPAELMPDSLRVEGKSAIDLTLGAIDYRVVTNAELAPAREREVTQALTELKDKRALIVADQQAQQAKRDFLAQLSQQAAERTKDNISNVDLKPEQWVNASNSLQNGMADALKALAARDVELREVDKQITAKETELNGLRTDQRRSISVKLPMEVASAGSVTLKLSYQLPRAGWRPVYEARLNTKTNKLVLTQFGEVRQLSGEDWQNIELTLSTARPAQGNALPRPTPAWLSLYDERQMRRTPSFVRETAMNVDLAQLSPAAPAGMSAQNSGLPLPEPQQKAIGFREATLETGGFVNEYKIPGTADVTADNSARKVMIGTLNVDADTYLEVQPAVASSAYLAARIKLNGDAPLLPGAVSIFRDGVFIGSNTLPLLQPGKETVLYFGIDDQVAVKRDLLDNKSGTEGLIAADATLVRQTQTSVQNLRKQPVKVEVLEPTPVPQDERIKIQLDEKKTTPGFAKDYDNTKGLLRWAIELAPSAKKDITLGWSLAWPKDMQLNGLP